MPVPSPSAAYRSPSAAAKSSALPVSPATASGNWSRFSPANVSYHFNVLQGCDCIERVGVIPRQGADESQGADENLYRTNPDVSRWIAAAGPT